MASRREQSHSSNDRQSRQSNPYQVQVITGRRKVYVGNLSYNVKWQDLKDIFKQYGDVTHATIEQYPDGMSKGFGIVEMARREDAAKAIDGLNNSDLNGRVMFVREDRESSSGRSSNSNTHSNTHDNSHSSTHNNSYGTGGSGGSGMNKKLFVANLPYEVKWQELKDIFKQYGEVIRADVDLYPDGKSKGFGTVEMANARDAIAAMNAINNVDINGRVIFVRENRDLNGGHGNSNNSSHSGGGNHNHNNFNHNKVYVGNLPWDHRWQDLKDLFKQLGHVVNAEVVTSPDGKSRGYGTVEYTNPQDAQTAIQKLNGQLINGRLIYVREDHSGSAPVEVIINSTPSSIVSINMPPVAVNRNSTGIYGNKLYVGNLSFDVTWRELKDHFKVCGDIIRADVGVDSNNRSKGYGIVEFACPEAAEAAAERLNNSFLNNRQIFVREDREDDR